MFYQKAYIVDLYVNRGRIGVDLMKEPNRTVYIRKASQKTLRELSEKTRLSQSEILAQWLDAIQEVLNRFENLNYDRLSMASYASNTHKQVLTCFAPIICGEPQFELDSKSESVNEANADLAIEKDIETRLSRNQGLTLREKNILIKARKNKKVN